MDWIADSLDDLQQAGLRRQLRTTAARRGATIDVEGRSLVNFGSNDYLGLAGDCRLTQAVIDAVREAGWGSGASALVTGHHELHRQAETRIAQFEQAEAALLFSSGFAANVGVITALVGRGDAVFGDQKNHASLIDGCRLSRAKVFVYPHLDCDALRQQLHQAGDFRRRLIVTDGLFSMDGDLAPLPEIIELAKQYDATVLVDEAHGTGVLGAAGRGAGEALGVEHGIDVRVGTLSKALGGIGGFVSGSHTLIEWVLNRARTYVFSTALPPAVCAAAIAALDIVDTEPDRRRELLARAAHLRRALRVCGWKVGDSQTQIIPISIGAAEDTMRTAARLFDRGFLVPGIRPPTVPQGESLLRVSLSYAHDETMIKRLVEALGRPSA